jgi:hypothetical protein
MEQLQSHICSSVCDPPCLPTTFNFTLLNGTNVRLNWNIESEMNVYWIKYKNILGLY